MSSYVPKDWSDGPAGGTPITAAELERMETQYAAALDDVAADITDPTSPIGGALSATFVAQPASPAVNDVLTWDDILGWLSKPAQGAEIDAFLGLAGWLHQATATDLTRSAGVSVNGDSTNTPDWAWFHLLAADIAAAFPDITHHYVKWNEPTYLVLESGEFDRPVVLHTGPNGARCLVSGGGPTAYQPGANIAATSDLDIRLDLKMTDWTPAAVIMLMTKWTDDASVSWNFHLRTDGTLRFQWRTTAGSSASWDGGDKTSSAAVGFSNGTRGWVRVTLDVNNGATGHDVKFWTSTDGTTWTQLGTTITTAGVSTVAASTSNYTLGFRTSSSNPFASGDRIYETQIREQIGGANLVPYYPENWYMMKQDSAGAAQLEGSPVLTWVMAAYPGVGLGSDSNPGGTGYAGTGYLTAKAARMTARFNQLVQFYSCSHNSYRENGSQYLNALDAYVTNTSSGAQANPVILTQNPRVPNDANENETNHALRRADVLAWGRRASRDVVDTYQAFLDDPRPLTTLINVDKTHPEGIGYELWKDYILGRINAALRRVTARQ